MMLTILAQGASADWKEAVYSRMDELQGYGGAKIGVHSLDGQAAYCTEPEKNWPEEGTLMTEKGSPVQIAGSETTAQLVMAAIQAYNALGETDTGGRRMASILIRYICKGYIVWDDGSGSVRFTVSEDPEGFAADYAGTEGFAGFMEEVADYDSAINTAMRERTGKPEYILRFSPGSQYLTQGPSAGEYTAVFYDSSGILSDSDGEAATELLAQLNRDDGEGGHIRFSASGSNITACVSEKALDSFFVNNGEYLSYTTGGVSGKMPSRGGYMPDENYALYSSDSSVQTLIKAKNSGCVRNITVPEMTLLFAEQSPGGSQGGIRIIKTSEDNEISGVGFTVTGTVQNSPSPSGLSGRISGWYITPGNSSDSCEWIGLAQSGDYTLIARVLPYENNLRWGTAGNYSASNVRGALEQRYAAAFPAKLKAAAAKSDANTSGLECNREISAPQRPARDGDTDILFAMSAGEYGAYLAEYSRYSFTSGYTRLESTAAEAARENASCLYNWEGTGRCWSRSRIYSESFEIYMPVWYGYSMPDSGTYVTPYSSDLASSYADLLPAIWVVTDSIAWSSESAQTAGREITMYVSTGTDGTAYVGSLPEGVYEISENTDLSRYVQQEAQTVSVGPGEIKTVRFENMLRRSSGTVTVHKSGEDGEVSGFRFTLTDADSGREGYEAVTGSSGTAVFEYIPFGTYVLKEEERAEYTPLKREITLSSSGCDAVINVRNSLIRGKLTIIKESALQGNVPDGDASFEGISFDLYAESNTDIYNGRVVRQYAPGEKIMTLTTGADGSVSTGDVLLGRGRYEVRETDTGTSGYVSDPYNVMEFEVSGLKYDAADGDGNALYVVRSKNIPETGGITVQKIDSETGENTPYPGASFEGAVFEITNRSRNPVIVDGKKYMPGEKITEIETDTGGKAETGSILPYGSYGIREIKAPEGYELSGEKLTATLHTAENVNVNVRETARKEVLKKTDAVTGGGIPGALVRITDIQSGEMYELTSGEDGGIPFVLHRNRKYSIQEIEAPPGYVRDSSIYCFETDANCAADYLPEIKNAPEGSVTISKTDAITGNSLEGAGISLYTMDGELIASGKTDSMGEVCFSLPENTAGTTACYKFMETAAPEGYSLNTDSHSFYVSPEGKVSGTLEITDVPVGTVAIKKTDENGGVLPGARLSIYTSSGTLAGQATTGSTGRVYFRPESPGSYYFVEDQAPAGYVRDGGKHMFSIDSNGNVSGTVKLVNRKLAGGATGDRSMAVPAAILSVLLCSGSAAMIIIRKKGAKRNGKQ